MRCLGIIPARFASSRFPGKPLAMIDGKTMIQRVYEQASKASSLSEVIVATDDERIFEHVKSFGGQVRMTSELHTSGTDRCNEVVNSLAKEKKFFDVVVNIQGDEPYINPIQIEQLTTAFENEQTEIATLIKLISNADEVVSPNVVKVITQKNGQAIYFSRFAIPFIRSQKITDRQSHAFYKHLGIYAYRVDVLQQICALPNSILELAESLEQLRWIENGFTIQTKITDFESIAVDVPEDLLKLTNKS